MHEATRIVLVRHGETAWNVDARIQGSLDIELNERGRQQAQDVAQALVGEDITTVYTSDLWRARDTAVVIGAALGLQPIPVEGLRERLFGKFEGKTFAEVELLWPEEAMRWRKRDPHYCPQGGESLTDFRARVVGCALNLARRHLGEHIVLVTHGGVNDVLYRAATSLSLQAARTWTLGNCEINRILWSEGSGFCLVGWGDDAHLRHAALDEVNNPR